MEYQFHGPPIGGVAIERAGIVLGDTLLQTAASASDVIRAVTTKQDVNKTSHDQCCSAAGASFEMALRASSG
jgi:hypothetical protein